MTNSPAPTGLKTVRICVQRADKRTFGALDETGATVASGRDPRKLSQAAFDAGAEEVRWSGEACLAAFEWGF